MHRLSWVVGAVLFLGLVTTSGLAGPPKGFPIPPDIQAILDKKKRHEALTMDDIKKLQDWAAGVQAHLPTPPLPPGTPGAPAATTDAPPIPVRFELTAHYTRTQRSSTQTFDITESAPLALIAKVNGTGDYVKGVLDPSAKISSFLFQQATGSGGGHYHVHATQPRGSSDFESALSDVTGGLMLVTVGGDTLGIIPGQMLGAVDGTYHNVEDGKAVTESYKGAVRESLVDLLFPWEAHVTKDRTKPVPNPRAKISYSTLVAAIQSRKMTPIKVSEHFDWNDRGEQVAGDVDVIITVLPAPPPRIEARIEPVGDWEHWMPEGPTPKRGHGNTMTAKIALYDPATHAPWKGTVKVDSVTLSLEEVSHLPGVCTNWPAKGEGEYEEKPDLFFATSNKFGKAKDDERQTWELTGRDWFQPVTIESRDFAASGRLTAHVNLADGTPLVATFKQRETPFLPIPRDDDHNKISDAWEPGRGLDGAADDEDFPAFREKGDGFTVMEEYRGFLVSPSRKPARDLMDAPDEDHRRLDPKTRELLVVLDVDPGKEEALVTKGVQIFESAALMKVYALASTKRLHPYRDDKLYPRGVVWNVSPPDSQTAADSTKTLGVWITSHALRPDSVARSWPLKDYDGKHCANFPFDCERAPETIRYVAIGPPSKSVATINWMIGLVDPDSTSGGDNTRKARHLVDGYLQSQGISDAERRAAVATARANISTLVDEMAGFSIAHELGHTLGAQHHGTFDNDPKISTAEGPVNCPMRYWQALNSNNQDIVDADDNVIGQRFLGFNVDPENVKIWMRFFTGKWNPIVSGPTGIWMICERNIHEMGFRP